MSEEHGREFNTVEEILETYVPDYWSSETDTPGQGKVGLGVQLAATLMEDFRNNLRKGANGNTQNTIHAEKPMRLGEEEKKTARLVTKKNITNWLTKEQIAKHMAGCRFCGGKVYRNGLCKLCWDLRFPKEDN